MSLSRTPDDVFVSSLLKDLAAAEDAATAPNQADRDTAWRLGVAAVGTLHRRRQRRRLLFTAASTPRTRLRT